jgi:hypothetical protein
MAKGKHYVFSARTTRDGLRQLNDVKRERGLSWDDLVIDAVCAHYGLDRSALALPKPRVLTELPGAAEEPEGETAGSIEG